MYLEIVKIEAESGCHSLQALRLGCSRGYLWVPPPERLSCLQGLMATFPPPFSPTMSGLLSRRLICSLWWMKSMYRCHEYLPTSFTNEKKRTAPNWCFKMYLKVLFFLLLESRNASMRNMLIYIPGILSLFRIVTKRNCQRYKLWRNCWFSFRRSCSQWKTESMNKTTQRHLEAGVTWVKLT